MNIKDNAHIASAFDRDLEAAQALIMKMGGVVEDMILRAAEALETGDIDMAEDVRATDAKVDDLEAQINEEAARLIALRAPTAVDLRMVLTVMRMASNLERVGDYTKNLAKRTSILMEMPQIDSAGGSLRRMSKTVAAMLSDVLDAYVKGDAALAEAVRLRDEEVDQMYNALFREFLTHMMEDPRNITPCMHLHFIAKNIERMGDHVTNVAEEVIYLYTGERPEDERPKMDSAVTT